VLAGTVVFVNDIASVPTLKRSFQVLHNPPPIREKHRSSTIEGTRDRVLIATSRYSARLWAEFLEVNPASIHVVYPFAEPPFAAAIREAAPAGVVRILYAGRLSPEKGIYTLLAMLHIDVIAEDRTLSFTVTTAGSDKPQGRIIEQFVHAHPEINLVDARRTPATMAGLMAAHDIVLMPSNGQYWHETFGIVSIEAQHSGCRVVASDDGGLPETNCGAVILVEPDNAEALASGIRAAIARGPISPAEREVATGRFTVAHSVDALLDILTRYGHPPDPDIDRELETLIQLPSTDPSPVRNLTEMRSRETVRRVRAA
jgi:D-inositol-3-phosphate glycosyltransferase